MSESKRERYIRLLKSKADLNFVELTFDAVKEIIELLEETSAEPEIIRCKDCKHYAPEVGDDSYAIGYCPFIGSHLVMSKGFCAWGERRGESDG